MLQETGHDFVAMREKTSESLWNRYLGGSETAPFAILERYQSRVIALARTRLFNGLSGKVDPEDVSQEVFVTLFELADRNQIRWEKEGDLWRLLAGIAINKVREKIEHFGARKRSRHLEVELSENSRLPSAMSEQHASVELNELVDDLLATEKPLMKRIVSFCLAGFDQAEIASEIGRSTRTVRRMLDSLRAKILDAESMDLSFGANTKQGNKKIAFTGQQQVAYEDFQLLQMIGQGSFAKVYTAKHHRSGKLFAIKAIRKKWLDHPKVRSTFENEFRTLLAFKDPHVVEVHGLGRLPNQGYFLVLELVDGIPIAQKLEDALPSEAENWWKQLTETVQRLTNAGIVHGDLRPDNILIDSGNRIKIVDFGFASRFSVLAMKPSSDQNALENLRKLFAPSVYDSK